MSSRRRTLALMICAGLLLAAAAGLRAQTTPALTEEFHQSYPLAAGGRVSLSNINGGVRIRGWDRDEVRVDAVKRAATQELLREAQIRVDAAPGSVRIQTDYPDRRR